MERDGREDTEFLDSVLPQRNALWLFWFYKEIDPLFSLFKLVCIGFATKLILIYIFFCVYVYVYACVILFKLFTLYWGIVN